MRRLGFDKKAVAACLGMDNLARHAFLQGRLKVEEHMLLAALTGLLSAEQNLRLSRDAASLREEYAVTTRCRAVSGYNRTAGCRRDKKLSTCHHASE